MVVTSHNYPPPKKISRGPFSVMDKAVCNFADDTTILAADCQLDRVLERLETDALVLSKWFPENFMKYTTLMNSLVIEIIQNSSI